MKAHELNGDSVFGVFTIYTDMCPYDAALHDMRNRHDGLIRLFSTRAGVAGDYVDSYRKSS